MIARNKLISEKIKQQLREKESSVLMFQRPQESLRVFYEMARDPANKQRLKDSSQNNPVFAALSQVLDKHELPPFSVVEKYLTPTGAFVTEDEFEYPVSVNGKTRFKITIPLNLSKEEIESQVMQSAEMNRFLEGKAAKKVIVVPGRIVNVVV